MPVDPGHHDPSTLDLAVLERRVRALEQDVARLTARPDRPADDIDSSVEALWTALSAYGPLPEHRAARLYGRAAVVSAVRQRLIHRDPSAPGRMLTALTPTEAALDRLAEALKDGPQPLSVLRTLESLNKNTLSDLVLRGVHEGHFRQGTIRTGKSGRPQAIVARADQPLPIYWDEWKIDWRS
jgi:hypothetical protein